MLPSRIYMVLEVFRSQHGPHLQQAIVHAEGHRQQPDIHWGGLPTPLEQWVHEAAPSVVRKKHACTKA